MKAAVEICAEGIASALAAGRGGADRVELCENLAVGGVTPGPGSIALAAERLAVPVHVLVRPRGGDFVYSVDESEAIRRDVEIARTLGTAGVVFGCLTGEGRVDRDRTARWLDVARPMSVTFHKAFDATRDPLEALDDLIGLGVDRVLTSGHAPTAMEGLATLAELTRRASGRIAVMAGGSIARGQIRPIIGAGVREIHLGSAAYSGGAVDPGLVRRIAEAASIIPIYHITSQSEWERAIREGTYRPASMATEGFIHASTAGQVVGSANRFFRGRDGLIVLRIDLERLKAPVDWAASPDSDLPFPHVVGDLNLDAVIGIIPMEPGPDGEFAAPIDGLD